MVFSISLLSFLNKSKNLLCLKKPLTKEFKNEDLTNRPPLFVGGEGKIRLKEEEVEKE